MVFHRQGLECGIFSAYNGCCPPVTGKDLDQDQDTFSCLHWDTNCIKNESDNGKNRWKEPKEENHEGSRAKTRTGKFIRSRPNDGRILKPCSVRMARTAAVGACTGDWHANSSMPEGVNPNHQAFKKIVETGKPVGLLAYADEKAVGWMAIAPRDEYPTMDRSRVIKRVDQKKVWSISCFYTLRVPTQRCHGGFDRSSQGLCPTATWDDYRGLPYRAP